MLQGFLASFSGFKAVSDETKNDDDNRDATMSADAAPPQAIDHRIEALKALLANPNFRASARNKRFLEFVVKETVAGRAERIKAFTVAVDVFGRGADFDPLSDPIVRISAGHLRRSLDTYYATHGKVDPIRIRIPLGTYVPVFEKRENLPQRLRRRVGALVAERKSRLQSGAAGALMALAAAGAAVSYLSLDAAGPKAQPPRPVVVVDSARIHIDSDTADNALAHLFTQSLWLALADEHAVRLIGVGPEEKLGAVLRRTRENLERGVPLYQILTTVQAQKGSFHVYWHILDGRTNEAYLSASATGTLSLQEQSAAPESIARLIAASLRRLPRAKAARSPVVRNTLTGAQR